MQNLNQLLKVLIQSNFDFVLIGGFAGVVHGASMVTKDVDICGLLTVENVNSLREILRSYHPKHRMSPQKFSFLKYPKDISQLNNLYLETDLGIIDIICSVSGVGDFERIKKKAVTIKIFGFECKVISIEDLIAAKKALGRVKDLHAVEELKVILQKRAAFQRLIKLGGTDPKAKAGRRKR